VRVIDVLSLASTHLEETKARRSRGEFVVNDFAFVSMPASDWMAAGTQPWRRPGLLAIGAVFVAQRALV